MNHTVPTDGKIRHGDHVLAYYIFLDVVGFTLKIVPFQTKIIEHLNKIVRDSVRDHGVHESQRVFLPTGDGMCIVLIDIMAEPAIDLRIARDILKRIENYNAASSDESRFNVRIGLNDNVDTLVADVNNRQNIAGEGINIASRIMNLADGSQILVSGRAFDRLNAEVDRARFRPFPVRLKHDIPQFVHQYLGEENEGLLNTSTPTKLLVSQSELAFPTPRQCEAITGKWSGYVKQEKGKLIEFEIDFELEIVGSEIVGIGKFEWENDRIELLIQRGRISTGDFVRLDYEEQKPGTIRYGTMLFELKKAAKLDGWFVGYAPEAVQKIIAGSIIVTKIENQN